MRIYYDKATGNVVQETGERSGDVIETTIEQDFLTYRALAERMPDTVGMIQLEYGDYAEDFQRGRLTRIDLKTEDLLFTYPENPGQEPEPPKLSLEAKVLQLRTDLTARLEASEAETTALQLALAESNEALTASKAETTATQLALAEIYEQFVTLQGGES